MSFVSILSFLPEILTSEKRIKTKASLNKNKSLFTYKYGEDKHKSQLKSINEFLDKMLNFIDAIFDSNEKMYLLEKVIPFLEAKYESEDWKLNKRDINYTNKPLYCYLSYYQRQKGNWCSKKS